MSQSDPVNTPTPIMSLSADAPEKRGRGRPRKYPRLNFEENVSGEKNMNVKRRDITRIPAGYEWENGYRWRQVNRGESGSDLMLGQVVSGVIEAVFDAGYLLCVRVGNSGTTLRGVVFKPGHYVPVSAVNDVAPDVQMIRREEIPVQTDGREFKSRTGNGTFSFNEAIETKQASRPASHSPSYISATGKQISPLASQTAHPVLSRGNVVPVIFQPSNLVKGAPVSSESSYVATSKGKQVPEASIPSNESTPDAAAVDKEALFSQSQICQPVDTEGIHFEYDPSNEPPSGSLDDVEAKSTKFPGLPFENLVTEVIKRIHPSPLEETQIEFNQFASNSLEEETNNNAAQPLIIEPLQAVQPDPPANTESFPEPLENNRAIGMRELLQETMTQTDKPRADVITPRSWNGSR